MWPSGPTAQGRETGQREGCDSRGREEGCSVGLRLRDLLPRSSRSTKRAIPHKAGVAEIGGALRGLLRPFPSDHRPAGVPRLDSSRADSGNGLKIPIQQLRKTSSLPGPAYPDDAGLDLRAGVSGVISAGEWSSVPVGIALALPAGTVGLVVPRSGLALRYGISVLNSPGMIDPGFRGEVHVLLSNMSSAPFTFDVGDRIAQLVLFAHTLVEWVLVDSLPDSPRGRDGFGASGT